MAEETGNTSDVRDQTKELSKRLWEETMRKRTIGRPAEALGEANIRAGELMEPGALAAGAAMTGLKPFVSAEPATGHLGVGNQQGYGRPTQAYKMTPAGLELVGTVRPAVPASEVGQETMQVTREAAKARLRMNIIGTSRMAAEGKEHKYLIEETIRQARAAGMTPAEIQAAQLEGERVAIELRGEERLQRSRHIDPVTGERGLPPTDDGLRYRAQTPAKPMGVYHAEALAEPPQVGTEPPRQYDPLAKERTAAGRDISYRPTSEFGAHLAGEPKLKGTRGGQTTTPAVSQAEPDVVEQMEKGERKGKADPRFRGGAVPGSTTASEVGWEPTGPLERAPSEGKLPDAPELTPRQLDTLANQRAWQTGIQRGEASKKAAGKKTRTYKGTGKPAGASPTLGGRAVGAAGAAAMAIPLLIAGGEGIASLLGKPEGDEVFIEMSRIEGGPLPKGALNKETMEAFKSDPNQVARFLQAGIFSAELARELAPSRAKGRKQAVENAMNKERK